MIFLKQDVSIFMIYLSLMELNVECPSFCYDFKYARQNPYTRVNAAA